MLICEVEKNTKERIRISVEEFKGHKFIDCRVYYEDAAGEWRPTRKGIALGADTIGQVIEALQKGSAALEDFLSSLPAQKKAGSRAGNAVHRKGRKRRRLTTATFQRRSGSGYLRSMVINFQSKIVKGHWH